MENEFEMLLQPIEVGALRLKNRMGRSPMLSGMASADGEVTEQLIDHYVSAAKGGSAMIIVEVTAVDWRYAIPLSQLRIHE